MPLFFMKTGFENSIINVPEKTAEGFQIEVLWMWVMTCRNWIFSRIKETLTNPEQTEFIRTPLFQYINHDTSWWQELEKFKDYSKKIKKVKENNKWGSCEITYDDNGKNITHQLHQQAEIIDQVGSPEKILTEVFGFTWDQIEFAKDWSVKLWQDIKYNPEQKTRTQQLIKSKPGYRGSDGGFYGQGEYGCLWTSIPWVYIIFDENEVCIRYFLGNNSSCSFSAIRSEN